MDEPISKRALIEYYCKRDCGMTREECTIGDCHEIGLIEEFPSAEHGTNLAEVGTDLISRAQAIYAVNRLSLGETDATRLAMRIGDYLERLPSVQPDIIRCRNCKFASGDSRICMKFGHSPIGELDFCAWAERRTDE